MCTSKYKLSFSNEAAWNVLLFSSMSISERIMPFYMSRKMRNSEKNAYLENVLDFLDLKYSVPRLLYVLLCWTFVVSKIEFSSHVVGMDGS